MVSPMTLESGSVTGGVGWCFSPASGRGGGAIPRKALRMPGLLPVLVLSVGLMSVSHAAIFIRVADADPIVIAAYRMAIAALVVIPYAVARARPAFTALGGRQMGWLVVAGVLLAAHFATWIASLDLTSIAHSVVLVTLTPIWLVIFGIVLRRARPTVFAVASACLAASGSAVMAFGGGGDGQTSLGGDALALLGGLCMALYLLVGAHVRQGLALLPFLAIVYGVAAATLWAAVLISGAPFAGFDLTTVAALLALGLISQLLGHGAFNWALARFSPAFVAVLLLGEPILSALFGVFYFAEVPGPVTLLGAGVILAGLALGVRAEIHAHAVSKTGGPGAGV